jgi:hypothetical protein
MTEHRTIKNIVAFLRLPLAVHANSATLEGGTGFTPVVLPSNKREKDPLYRFSDLPPEEPISPLPSFEF